jgi:hypothetical protein
MRWEYALMSDQASGDDTIQFSHPQGPQLVPWFSEALKRALKAERSTERLLVLNLNYAAQVHVCGLLGERGWEMVGFSTLTGGHAYWMFKKPLP